MLTRLTVVIISQYTHISNKKKTLKVIIYEYLFLFYYYLYFQMIFLQSVNKKHIYKTFSKKKKKDVAQGHLCITMLLCRGDIPPDAVSKLHPKLKVYKVMK